MTKPLTHNEISVLEENFDLFGSPIEQLPNLNDQPTNGLRHYAGKSAKADEKNSMSCGEDLFGPTVAPTQPARPAPQQTIDAPAPTKTAAINTTEESSEKYFGLRASSTTKAKEILARYDISIINYALEKRDPALRNLSDALFDSGLEHQINRQSLYWFLIDDDRQCRQLFELGPVEITFCAQWFADQKKRIRPLRGADYINACADIASQFSIKDQQRNIDAA